MRVISIGEGRNKFVSLRELASLDKLFVGCVFVAPTEIFLDSSGEEQILLKNHCNFAAERVKIVVFDVHAANANSTFGCVVKSRNELNEILSRIAARVYTITPDNPRALSSAEFAKCISDLGTEAHPSSSISEAVSLAYADAKESGMPLVCFGSLYTYGEVASEIEKIKKEA